MAIVTAMDQRKGSIDFAGQRKGSTQLGGRQEVGRVAGHGDHFPGFAEVTVPRNPFDLDQVSH
jgi:hypothetical protein